MGEAVMREDLVNAWRMKKKEKALINKAIDKDINKIIRENSNESSKNRKSKNRKATVS